MKIMKMLAVTALTMAAVESRADIGVSWSSTTYFLKAGGNVANYPADYLPTNTLRILIWSLNAPPAANYANPTTGIGANEYILATVNSGSDDSGLLDLSAPPMVRADADVGGNNINNGYIYSRIFSSNAPVAGEWYFQSLVNLAPTLTSYDSMNPATILEHITSDVNSDPLREMGVGSGMYTVIPEPGTLLLALPFFGVMAVRRLRRQD